MQVIDYIINLSEWWFKCMLLLLVTKEWKISEPKLSVEWLKLIYVTIYMFCAVLEGTHWESKQAHYCCYRDSHCHTETTRPHRNYWWQNIQTQREESYFAGRGLSMTLCFMYNCKYILCIYNYVNILKHFIKYPDWTKSVDWKL